MNLLGPKSGFHLFGGDALLQGFVLTLAAVGQVAAFGLERGVLVAIDGDVQLLADPFGQLAGILHSLFHRDVGDGHERAHVGGAEARVVAVVVTHVNQLLALGDELHGGIDHIVGLAHKGDDRVVGGGTGVHVQQRHAFCLTDDIGHLVDDVLVSAFTKIRNTFY